jgi:hypothetical protein
MTCVDLAEHGQGRQLISFGNPLGFEIMEQNMRDNFRRIRIKCDVLLAQRVDQLANELRGTGIVDTACQVTKIQQIVTSVKIEPGSSPCAMH